MKMKKPSWTCTLAIQFTLCLAVYVALNFSRPQKSILQDTGRTSHLYFISVTGGFRPLRQQTQLLKLMENVAKAYKVKFVLDISDFGVDDPLLQNATQLFRSLEVPWYATGASKGQGASQFVECIKLPLGKSLDIISVDTGKLLDSLFMGSSRGTENNQLKWLTRTLEATNSNWHMVVGFDPLFVCKLNEEQMKAKHLNELLHLIFVKYGVNVYLSRQSCTNYVHQDGVTYIGSPRPIEKKPYVSPANGISAFKRVMGDGFLLHRVSSLEIVTYYVTSAGEVTYKATVQERGKEVM